MALESTTNKVYAETPEDLESRYPYQYWIPDDQCLILSKVILDGEDLSASNGIQIKNPTTGAWVTTSTTTYYTLYTTTYSTGDFFRFYYNAVTGWEAWLPDIVRRATTNPTIYYSAYGSGTLPSSVFTNGTSIPAPFTSGGTSLPSNIPPFDNVEDAINNALNASTGTTTQANYITSNIQNQTQKFENGEITQEVFELNINMALEVLDELQNTPGNTLADQVAINNALTATQTAQDKINHYDLKDFIQEQNIKDNSLTDAATIFELCQAILDASTDIYNLYINGEISKDGALNGTITDDEQEIYGLTYYQGIFAAAIASEIPLTDQDRFVIQNAINTLEQTADNINNSGDVNQSIADSFESSESEEIELLNEMLGVMQDQETDSIMQNQQVKDDLGQVSNWLEPIWNNKYFQLLIISVALLAPIAVILDMRYKGL